MKILNVLSIMVILSIQCNAYIVSNFATPENQTVNFIISYVSEGEKLPSEFVLNAFNIYYNIIFTSSLSGSEFTILACDFNNND